LIANKKLTGHFQPIIAMNLEIPVGALMGLKALDSSVLGCQQLASKIKSTYGPRGRDKLLELQDGTIIVSNDGATILKHLNPTHPIAQMLVNLSKTQDEIVGDGTTSIVLFVSFLLQQAQKLIHLGGSIDDIIEGYQVISNRSHLEITRDLSGKFTTY
jgi:chaperonin GroEL (HSP60 family)